MSGVSTEDSINLSRPTSSILTSTGTHPPIEGLNWSKRAVFGFNSRDRRSRPFNLLRSQVMKAIRANGWRIIGITSATPRVGKSFIASNLASSLSRLANVRTFLFDLDLRRGSVAEIFQIDEGASINQYLAGEIAGLGDAAREIAGTNLTLYPCFPDDNSSAELLAGQRMRTLVQAMRALPKDVICLCDLPPVFANDDAVIVTREIDAYILVIEEGLTTAKQVRDAMSLLSPAPCLGTVLNRFRGGLADDAYGYGYGQQSGYDEYYS